MRMKHYTVGGLFLPLLVAAQQATPSCNAPKPSGNIKPSIASGYRLQVVATGLSKPRGLAFDSAGNLLVVEAGSGSVSAHTLEDNAGCVLISNSRDVVSNLGLNHGIQMSEDGRTLYASDVDKVYSWDYDAADRSGVNQLTLIQGMENSDHSTRTLQLASRAPGMLVVSRGSAENLDYDAAELESGSSQVKAFNLDERGDRVYNFSSDGVRLGWGLRNDVGVAEHPLSGGIWTVENSADNINRDGDLVNQNNPAEELNFLGYLNGTEYANQGGNFGYPWCFTAWAPQELPNSQNLTVGKQFALSQSKDLNNENKTDEYCAQQVPARLSFQAHMAPIDLKFNRSGTEGWISFRGSWNRETPTGYKMSVVEFNNGEPTAPSNSTTALTDIVKNQDDTACPGDCMRPTGVVIDSKGRVFFASDASGEVYMITRDSSSSGAGTPSSSGSTPSTTPNFGQRLLPSLWPSMIISLLALGMVVL